MARTKMSDVLTDKIGAIIVISAIFLSTLVLFFEVSPYILILTFILAIIGASKPFWKDIRKSF